MNKIDAIKRCNGMIKRLEHAAYGELNIEAIKDIEALDEVISVLKKQEQEVDKSCETCKYKSRSAQEIPCCDCYMASCFEDCYEPYTEEN